MNQVLSDFYLFVGLEPYVWFALLVMASLLDALTTLYALRRPGFQEANPVLRWLMRQLGAVSALLVIKGLPLMILFYSLQDHILYVPLAVLMYSGIAAWNIATIYRGANRTTVA